MKYLQNIFKGRISRSNLVLGLLSSTVLLLAYIFLLVHRDSILGQTYILVGILALIFNLSLFVRRWHDLGQSEWMVLLNFIPFMGWLVLLYLVFKGGQDKENKYGKVPNKKIKYPHDILGLN